MTSFSSKLCQNHSLECLRLKKKIVRCCFVCMSGEALFGIQIYYVWIFLLPWPAFCRSVFFNFLLQRTMSPAVCSGCRASYVDSPWSNWCQPGTGLSTSSQNPSHSFIQCPNDGPELQEVSQHTAVDTAPLLKHYTSDSHLLQSPFKEGMLGNVKFTVSLGWSDHELVGFKTLRAARRAHSKLTTLDF